MSKCQPVALGIAVGAVWALYVGCLAVFAMFGWGETFVTLLASLYIGYAASVIGAIIGAVWAFLDGFVAGFIVGWVYNRAAKRLSCCESTCCSE